MEFWWLDLLPYPGFITFLLVILAEIYINTIRKTGEQQLPLVSFFRLQTRQNDPRIPV